MKKIITIILAVLMTLTTFASVSTTASTEIDVTNVATATTTNNADTSTTTTTTQVVKNTQRIPLKRPKISKITVGKFSVENTTYRVPKITFKKIPNATRYRVAFKSPNKPKKWQYFTTKKNKVLVDNGHLSGSGKYYVKVRAESPNTKYKAGKWSKVKTITINKYETYNKNCYLCGKRIGYGNGKCQQYTTDGWCSYCCEKVTAYKCHSCTNANPKKAYCIYDHDTGKIFDCYTAQQLRNLGMLVEGMKYY